jgi:hypothetical protein
MNFQELSATKALPSHLQSQGCWNHPAVQVVALAAIGGETQCLVIGRSGLLKCFQVAANAFGRQALAIEPSNRSNFVTGVAIHQGVSPDERKAVLVLVDVVHRYLPAIDAVAKITFGSVLAAMDVSVTVLALASDVGEYAIDMALLAGDIHVHTAQRIPGFSVIKLWVLADGHPGRGGVTVLAGSLQWAVRILRGRGRSRLPEGCAQRHLTPDHDR